MHFRGTEKLLIKELSRKEKMLELGLGGLLSQWLGHNWHLVGRGQGSEPSLPWINSPRKEVYCFSRDSNVKYRARHLGAKKLVYNYLSLDANSVLHINHRGYVFFFFFFWYHSNIQEYFLIFQECNYLVKQRNIAFCFVQNFYIHI